MRLGVIAVDPLVELTEDPKPRVRHDAIHALGKVGYDRAAIPVWLRLWDDPTVISKVALRSVSSTSAAPPPSWHRC